MEKSGTTAKSRTSSCAWSEICDAISSTFKLSREAESRLRESKTARLIAELPFVAGCENPKRTALANLSVYILAATGGKEAFLHSPDDDWDVFARLRLGMNHHGGNKRTLAHGMAVLALIMLHDYRRDEEDDLSTGKYNPLNSGVWNFQEKKNTLLRIIADNFDPAIEEIADTSEVSTIPWS